MNRRTRKAAEHLIRHHQNTDGLIKSPRTLRVEAAIWEAAGDYVMAEFLTNEADYLEEHPSCVSDDNEATHWDVDGVPLCDECWEELIVSADQT